MARYIQTREPYQLVTFRCFECKYTFDSIPEKVEENSDQSHPWDYFCFCPYCSDLVSQAPWDKATMQSMGKHTGPKTPEGRAASAANLDGHPTPEEASRTRLNALKHGLYAKVSNYFPARDGKYPDCSGCRYSLADGDGSCSDLPACMRRTEIFMRNQIAAETQDPSVLMTLHAERQSVVQSIVDMILHAIIATGVELKNPEWYFDPKAEKFHIVSYEVGGEINYSYKISAHPLLKTLTDFLQKNNLSLADINMTPKVSSEQDIARGYLDQTSTKTIDITEYQQKQLDQLGMLRTQILQSQEQTEADPVLVQYKEAGND